MKDLPKISVVVCTKNEEKRIEKCLLSIIENELDEIIVVDGASTDNTVELAKKFNTIVVNSKQGSLTKDRQLGIDTAKNPYIFMVDADHRLTKDSIVSLYRDLIEFQLDMVQSQLKSYKNNGFWDRAEEESWDITHNIPGIRKMIGTAPTLYKKELFKHVRFDDRVTKTIDDTDFIYRLSKIKHLRIGVGRTIIFQEHFSDFKTYIKKFLWYGKGDGEFCIKNPERAPSMIFHLLIRYPIIYSFKALYSLRVKASIFFIFQGFCRLFGLIKYILYDNKY